MLKTVLALWFLTVLALGCSPYRDLLVIFVPVSMAVAIFNGMASKGDPEERA
jgi:hypothetical protein